MARVLVMVMAGGCGVRYKKCFGKGNSDPSQPGVSHSKLLHTKRCKNGKVRHVLHETKTNLSLTKICSDCGLGSQPTTRWVHLERLPAGVPHCEDLQLHPVQGSAKREWSYQVSMRIIFHNMCAHPSLFSTKNCLDKITSCTVTPTFSHLKCE